jgi:hypothetical protein
MADHVATNVQNYFNYFTEIEEHFQRRRGSLLILSTLDWALIETWREAGVPLDAVLRGIDAAFDKYETRKSKSRLRRVNGLAYCAQAVISAVEDMKEAAVGAAPAKQAAGRDQEGLEQERVAAHLESCAQQLRASPQAPAVSGISQRLDLLAAATRAVKPNLEELEANLSALEEKLFATLISQMPEPELLALRRQASGELAPYRSRMQAMQIRQIEQQFLHKRLLEKFLLPRLSLFYMSQS